VQPLSTDKLGDPLHPFPAITVSVCNLRPESRGNVHLRSRDPHEQPDIRLNYLSAPRDRDVAVLAVRQARQIMTAKALARYQPEEILPGPDTSRTRRWSSRSATSRRRFSIRSAPAGWAGTRRQWWIRNSASGVSPVCA
jgi:choline dehydrogenase-like flavoprotein